MIYLNTNLETLSVISGYNKGDWFGDTTNRKNISLGMSKKSAFDYFLYGQLDEFRVYNICLTQSQVLQNYNSTRRNYLYE
jgi:hypothetical protein